MLKTIRIYIACHKESNLPKNALFAPIHVGAKLSNKTLDGLLRDDTGENISEKNPYYCELTAQYWAWKNDSESDYIGLCHYRRYLCFADVSNLQVHRNRRKHIEAYAIDDYNIGRFGLENEAEMRSVIETNDVVVGESQKVSKLPTPRGHKNTAYKHWAAHDRDFLVKEDLDAMLSILDESFPKFARITRDYLSTNTFLGFNCFVMRRSLFEELCQIEFTTLEKLEARTDLSNHSQEQSRIYGFMGEIIFSAYIYYLEKQKKCKVKHVPILYFNYTEKLPEIKPTEQKNTISVLFSHLEKDAMLFAPNLLSFLERTQKDFFYDILLLSSPLKSAEKKFFLQLVSEFQNVRLRFLDADLFSNQIKERYSVMELKAFLPYMLPYFKKVLFFDSNSLFNESVVPLWNTEFSGNEIVACPYDIPAISKINGFSSDTERILKRHLQTPVEFFCMNSMLWDFEKYRNRILPEKISEIVSEIENDKKKISDEILNILLQAQGYIKKLPQKWAVWKFARDSAQKLRSVPLCILKDVQAAETSPAIILYEIGMPLKSDDYIFLNTYWTFARKAQVYEYVMFHVRKYTNMTKFMKLLYVVEHDGIRAGILKIIRYMM